MFKSFIKLFSLAIFPFAFTISSSQAQNVKPKFKKLVNVYYELDSTNSNKIIIKDYVEILGNGQVHSMSVYYKGIADTTYQLPDTMTFYLNKIFNGEKSLKSYLIRTKLTEGEHFSGPLEFVTYVDGNNKTDEIIVIDGFMDKEFDWIYNKLYRLPFVKKVRPGKSIQNRLIEAKILKFQKACKYIPKIEQPPRIEELKN